MKRAQMIFYRYTFVIGGLRLRASPPLIDAQIFAAALPATTHCLMRSKPDPTRSHAHRTRPRAGFNELL